MHWALYPYLTYKRNCIKNRIYEIICNITMTQQIIIIHMMRSHKHHGSHTNNYTTRCSTVWLISTVDFHVTSTIATTPCHIMVTWSLKDGIRQLDSYEWPMKQETYYPNQNIFISQQWKKNIRRHLLEKLDDKIFWRFFFSTVGGGIKKKHHERKVLPKSEI